MESATVPRMVPVTAWADAVRARDKWRQDDETGGEELSKTKQSCDRKHRSCVPLSDVDGPGARTAHGDLPRG